MLTAAKDQRILFKAPTSSLAQKHSSTHQNTSSVKIEKKIYVGTLANAVSATTQSCILRQEQIERTRDGAHDAIG